MFTGELKDRRVSGLTKRNSSNSKDAFLQETRKKREERAIQKLKENASITIQSYYRGYSSRIKTKNDAKNDFNKKITDISKIKSIFKINKGLTFLVPNDSLIKLFQIYLISLKCPRLKDKFNNTVFKFNQHIESLINIQNLLLESFHAVDQQQNILLNCSNMINEYNQNEPSFDTRLTTLISIFQIRDILQLTMLYLENYFTNYDRSNMIAFDSSINLLRAIIGSISSSDDSHYKLNMIISCLLVPSYCKSLKTLLQTSIQLSEEDQTKKMIYANSLIDSLVKAINIRDDSLNIFPTLNLRHNLWVNISEHLLTLSELTISPIFSHLITYLNSNNCEGWLLAYDTMFSVDRTSNSSNAQVAFLVNFFNAVLMLPTICTMITSFQGHGLVFLNSLQSFLNQVPLLTTLRSIELDSVDTVFDRSIPSGLTATMELKMSICYDLKLKQMEHWNIFQPHRIALENIFKNFLLNNGYISAFFDNISPDKSSSFASSTFSVITIYAEILMACPFSFEHLQSNPNFKRASIFKSILNSLAFSRPSSPLSKRLWQFLNTCGVESLEECINSLIDCNSNTIWNSPCISLQKLSIDLSIDISRLKEGLCNCLYLLCVVMSHQLIAVDDEEFFEEQKVMQLDDIKILIEILKKFLHRMYLVNPIFEKNDNSKLKLMQANLLEAMTTLFNALYSRHERRAFLLEEAWKWNNLNNNDFAIIEDSVSSDDSMLSSHQFRNPNVSLILKDLPQVIPFNQRVSIFHDLLAEDKRKFGSQFDGFFHNGTRISVRRDNIVHDTYQSLQSIQTMNFKRRLQVEFVSETGLQEAGIDGGGLYKAFMDSFAKAAFDVAFGFFQATSNELLFPNPASSMLGDHHLHYYNFLGKMLGKALYDNVIVEPQFSGVFLNVLLGRLNQIDDIWYLDETLHHNLMSLKKSSSEEIAALGLTFEIQSYHFGESVTKELIPNGSEVAVTKDNVHLYIHKYANYKLNVEVSDQSRAFMSGFRSIVPVSWIQMFSPKEMQLLISGDPKPIDIEDMRRNVAYGNGYHDSQPYIALFWEVVSEMTTQEQSKLLCFATSCPRLPLLGAKNLYPKFCIYRIPPPHNHRLPTAATCMNLLKLPQYEDKEMLREKLLYAISSNSGFELS